MKISSTLAAVGLALHMINPCGAQAASPKESAAVYLPSGAEARQHHLSIEQLLHAYERALNTSDVQGAARLYTDDGVLMAQGSKPAVGAAAVRDAYAGTFQAIGLDIKFQIAEAQLLSHEWALLRTTSTGVIKILANGAQVPEGNQELFLLRRVGGQWKIARYSFSTFLPAAN